MRERPDDPLVAALKVVQSLARKYEVFGLLSHDELVAAGNEALAHAQKRHDPNRGAQLSTFGFLRIQGAMVRALQKAARLRDSEELMFGEKLELVEPLKQGGPRGHKRTNEEPVDLIGPDGLDLSGDPEPERPDRSRQRHEPPPPDPGSTVKPPQVGSPCRVHDCTNTVAKNRNVCAVHLAQARRGR